MPTFDRDPSRLFGQYKTLFQRALDQPVPPPLHAEASLIDTGDTGTDMGSTVPEAPTPATTLSPAATERAGMLAVEVDNA